MRCHCHEEPQEPEFPPNQIIEEPALIDWPRHRTLLKLLWGHIKLRGWWWRYLWADIKITYWTFRNQRAKSKLIFLQAKAPTPNLSNN